MKCEDCKGSGVYVGFSSSESCKACAGKGTVPHPPPVAPTGYAPARHSRPWVSTSGSGTIAREIHDAWSVVATRHRRLPNQKVFSYDGVRETVTQGYDIHTYLCASNLVKRDECKVVRVQSGAVWEHFTFLDGSILRVNNNYPGSADKINFATGPHHGK